MGEWKNCTLSSLGTIVGGATPSTKKPENYEGGTIPWITPKDLSGFSGRYISHGERNITEKGLKSCSAQMMPKHSVLFSSRAPIGYVAISNCEVCTNQGFKSIVPSENTDYLFLYYLLQYKKKDIENLGSGTTFKEVSANTMKGVEVRVPAEKSEQEKIASVLSAIDDKIEENQKINDNLEQQMQALFSNRFPTIFHPKCDKTLSDLVSFSNGKKRPNTDGSIPVYGGNGILAYTDKSNAESCVIIGRVGAYCGNTFLCSGECWVSDNAIQATAKESSSQLFIYYLLKNAGLPSRHIGTSQPLLTQGILNAIPIEPPSNDAIQCFIDICSPIQQMIDSNNIEIQQLVTLRNELLPKLMFGELDVSELDI